MDGILAKDKRIFEIMLIIVVLGMAALFTHMGPYKIVVLNLFYVPIILSGYFLGRTSTGVLALFCVLAVTIASTLVYTPFTAFGTPLMVGLALTVWAAVLGLAAILVGTLCDERAATLKELHNAYVGVVEVLSKYLQGGNPRVKASSVRVAELSQLVAEELNLPPKQVDDIRVAALLHELGNVEITTQIISKAVGTLEAGATKHTFSGTELVHSLGSVLESALPLLANQDDTVRDCLADEHPLEAANIPIGARIIRAVRAYDAAANAATGPASTPSQALELLRQEDAVASDEQVIDALERAVKKPTRAATLAPAFA